MLNRPSGLEASGRPLRRGVDRNDVQEAPRPIRRVRRKDYQSALPASESAGHDVNRIVISRAIRFLACEQGDETPQGERLCRAIG
jgi:hypothetical protein